MKQTHSGLTMTTDRRLASPNNKNTDKVVPSSTMMNSAAEDAESQLAFALIAVAESQSRSLTGTSTQANITLDNGRQGSCSPKATTVTVALSSTGLMSLLDRPKQMPIKISPTTNNANQATSNLNEFEWQGLGEDYVTPWKTDTKAQETAPCPDTSATGKNSDTGGDFTPFAMQPENSWQPKCTMTQGHLASDIFLNPFDANVANLADLELDPVHTTTVSQSLHRSLDHHRQ